MSIVSKFLYGRAAQPNRRTREFLKFEYSLLVRYPTVTIWNEKNANGEGGWEGGIKTDDTWSEDRRWAQKIIKRKREHEETDGYINQYRIAGNKKGRVMQDDENSISLDVGGMEKREKSESSHRGVRKIK